MPFYLSYFSSLLFIMAVLTEDKNGATESKCQSYYPIQSLIDLLAMCKECWELRKSIILFYFHVYCDVEKETSEEQVFINKVTEITLDDFHSLS